MQISKQLRGAVVASAFVLASFSASGSNLNYLYGYSQPGMIATAASSDPLSSQSISFSSGGGTLASVSQLWGLSSSTPVLGSTNGYLGGVSAYSNLGGAWGTAASSTSSWGYSSGDTGFGSTSNFASSNFGSAYSGTTSFFGSSSSALGYFSNSNLSLWSNSTPNSNFGAPIVYPAFGNIGLNVVNTKPVTPTLPTTFQSPTVGPLISAPEPSTWFMLVTGMGALAMLRRRRAVR